MVGKQGFIFFPGFLPVLSLVTLLCGVTFLSGCSLYQVKVHQARKDINQRQFQSAVEKLKPLADRDGDDQLVYLLDYGMALHLSKQYKKSNQVFLKAARLAQTKDYHSVSRVAGSLALSENMIQYKGDDYEKLLIHIYLALNYILLKEHDESLVEVRRLNELLDKFRIDRKKRYQQNAFARYLSAIVWETDGKWDDAYIDYKKTWQLNPKIKFLKEDLLRSSYKAQRMREYRKWKKEFPEIKTNPKKWNDRLYGEVVLIFEQGWGPKKRPRITDFRFPELVPSKTATQRARVTVNGVGSFVSQKVYDIQSVAIQTLNDDYNALVAKKFAGIVTKEVLADQVRQKNETLGNLASIALNLSDQADLRQWSTLPETLQIAKARLRPGEYFINIQGLSRNGRPIEQGPQGIKIKVQAGQKVFLNWRSLK